VLFRTGHDNCNLVRRGTKGSAEESPHRNERHQCCAACIQAMKCCIACEQVQEVILWASCYLQSARVILS